VREAAVGDEEEEVGAVRWICEGGYLLSESTVVRGIEEGRFPKGCPFSNEKGDPSHRLKAAGATQRERCLYRALGRRALSVEFFFD
jgi:hypothetical protein